ncbi:MAG: hypothetical protein ACOC3B_02385, partial [Bacillota bacterium]
FSQYFLDEVFQASATLYAPSFTLLNGEVLNNGEYTNFFYRVEVFEEIVEEYDLRKENPDISYENLRNKLNINIDEDTNIVRLTLQDSSPKLAAAMLESWYVLAREQLVDFIDSRNERYLSDLENNWDRYQKEYLSSLDQLEEFKEEINLDLLKAELRAKENSLVLDQEKIIDKDIGINKSQTEYQTVLNQLQETEKFLNLQVPVSEAVLYFLDYESQSIDDWLVQEEILNPQYEKLKSSKNNIDQRIAAEREELHLLENKVSNIEVEINDLQKEIVSQDKRRQILEKNYDLYNSSYNRAEERYNDAVQQLANYDYDISVLNEPFTPRTRISPNKKLNVAIAGVLGLMLAIFYVFFREYMKDEENLSEKGKYHEA